MAMRTASPWWFSLIYALGLAFVFIGERAFGHDPDVRMIATALGALVVVGITGLRVWAYLGTRGTRRAVERTLLLCHAAGALALIVYSLTTSWGQDLLGLGPDAVKARTMLTISWAILMGLSLIPLLMIELTLGTAQRDLFARKDLQGGAADDEAVEYLRVKDTATSGVSIALAAAFLLVTCNVAKERNIHRDVSYFKTSSPGPATQALVGQFAEPLKVLLFFEDVSEVAEEVNGYFEELASKTGRVTIERHHRLEAQALAKQYKVGDHGTIVLAKGEKSELVKINPEMKEARKNELRTFDAKINKALSSLARDKKTAYLTVGHGELNDPDSLGPMAQKFPNAQAGDARKLLEAQNYKVEKLGLADLAIDVPEDATLVVMMAPRSPLHEGELAALGRYLDRGGSVLLVLDPVGDAVLGEELEGRLGITFDAGELTEDKEFMPQRGAPTDRRLVLTNQFSAHSSVTSLGRGSARAGVMLVNAGTLRDRDFVGFAEGKLPKRTYVVRSMSTSWVDLDDNFRFDEATEKRDKYNVVAVVEGPAPEDDAADAPAEPAPDEAADADKDADKAKDEAAKKKKSGFRAMVVADGDLFTDRMLQTVPLAGDFVGDAFKWLGGEEVLAGAIITEKDVFIQHTRSKDQVWFYLSIIGAPCLVLGVGLVLTRKRRKTAPASKKRAS
jgi:hypothetical protein